MDITNNSKSRLVLTDGQSVMSGETVSSPDFDQDNHVMKAWIDAGLISVADSTDDQLKPLTKMKVNELQNYIADNGGDFELDDKKDDLLLIAQEIESKLNDNQE